MSRITHHITIANHKIFKNGELFFEADPALSLKDFLKASWKNLKVKYPKFYKMDEISKLGMLAAEVLLMDITYTDIAEEDIGVVLSNAHSTIATDINHWDSVSDDSAFFPSPAVFVYTLPNIMIGEICIKHKLKGENAFFISQHYGEALIKRHINLLMAQNKIQAAIGGWIDRSEKDYLAEIFWIKK